MSINNMEIDEIIQISLMRSRVESAYEWRKWQKEIPFLNFKEDWNVKVIPPFGGAVARFIVSLKDNENTWISVYLDCYHELGYFGSPNEDPVPYWEMYPYQYEDYKDTYRCAMNDTEELLKKIDEQLKVQLQAKSE